jgi:hypothetical protein
VVESRRKNLDLLYRNHAFFFPRRRKTRDFETPHYSSKQALARGIKIKMLLVDRVIIKVDCINTLNEMEIKFIMPCIANERVQSAIDTLGRTGKKLDKFPIYNADCIETSLTIVVVRNDKGERELVPFATNMSGWSSQNISSEEFQESTIRDGVLKSHFEER